MAPARELEYLHSKLDWTDPGVAQVYDELPLWSAMVGSILLDRVPLKPNVTLLDVGSGTGFPLLELAQRLGPSCVAIGLDPWRPAVDRARLKIRELGVRHVKVIEGDATAMPFDDRRFDLIVSNLGINNFADPAKAVAECWRVAKPGAIFALATNLRGHMRTFYDVYESTLRQLGNEDHVAALHDHIRHRITLEGLLDLLTAGGFALRKADQASISLRFLDGSSLLRHAFVRLAFLDAWRAVMGPSLEARVFSQLESNLNRVARERGELVLEIPIAYVETEKPALPR